MRAYVYCVVWRCIECEINNVVLRVCDVMWQNMRELNVRMIICGVCMLWVRVGVVSVSMCV